jgi:hypothetical protein
MGCVYLQFPEDLARSYRYKFRKNTNTLKNMFKKKKRYGPRQMAQQLRALNSSRGPRFPTIHMVSATSFRVSDPGHILGT